MAPSLEVLEKVADIPSVLTKKPTNGDISSGLKLESHEKHDRVLKVFRAYIADLCQQFNGGHPGYVKKLVVETRPEQRVMSANGNEVLPWAWLLLESPCTNTL
jgi:hypothetical protein